MSISTSDKPYKERIIDAESDKFMRAAVAKAQDAQFIKRTASRRELGNWNEWRDLAEQIRQHVLKYLPDYLEEFADNVEQQGGHVFFAKDENEAHNFIKELAIAKKAKNIVKSKSMVTTEINLDKTLKSIPGVNLLESDLAEFILQEDNWDEPTHIVFPTLHKNRDQIQEEFQKLGYDGDNDPQHEARFVRGYLRRFFMKADFGITGCNFAIANNGMINLDTNEGNADITMAIPKTQVVVMGMERIVPSMKEAEVLDNMLARSAVGQKLTTYCTFTGKKKDGELDGPDDFWVVIVDDGRSKALGTEFEPILQCIRCGACMNVCPVYRQVGGKGYGSIYPGPLGEVLSPILGGYEHFKDLPYACSLCAACTETCPVKIPLQHLIREHRIVEMDDKHLDHSMTNLILKMVGVGTDSPFLFGSAMKMAHPGTKLFNEGGPNSVEPMYDGGKIDYVPKAVPKLIHGWIDTRDVPRPVKAKENFRHWYKHHQPVDAAPAVKKEEGQADE
ncbi:LutB/LldF family L-lactate oxidation iron-sulfur protein [Limosilactobacillus viscerum]|uniref:LutB/LldF family L-lactate oxidation iron-sulfur protein n=1 Tax=Limosilactobacillus viscerum TaxID=2993450 RepID=UPI0024BB5353|nr:LutB/LldF family L-lactate oxidation iron-sulfur protein [Limosilactobacillus viscerum]